MSIVVILLIIAIALGTLLFMLGYGALFFGAFSQNAKVGVIFLVLLGFSSVGFVYAGKPWYYALPFWLIPVIYAMAVLPKSRNKRRAVGAFFIGLLLFGGSFGVLAYTALENADIQATIEQFKSQKNDSRQGQ